MRILMTGWNGIPAVYRDIVGYGDAIVTHLEEVCRG